MASKKKVKTFWQSKAKQKVKDSKVTHRDIWQKWLEIETIKKYLRKSARMIDVGCGNGFTTFEISPLVKEVVGIDYSDEMIKRASSNLKKKPKRISKNIQFNVYDVLQLESSSFGLFNIALSERCLINLNSWSDQKKAIKNIANVLKPGGRFIFIEGLKDGREQLNRFRKKVGLKQMPKVWHNIDFVEKDLLNYVKRHFIVEEKLYFGVYDFISRVVYPLFISPREPKYDSMLNKTAARLALQSQEFSDLSRVIVLILKKK